MATKRVLYFTAAAAPTVAEQTAITRLQALAGSTYDVQVRNGAATLNFVESADLAAGTIPTAYNGVSVFGGDGKIDAARPLAFKLFPATLAISAGTAPLYAIRANGSNADDITLVDTTATGVAYTSSDTGKATVGAATGIVTKVAAGTATITATLTYATGKTVTSTCAVTVS